MGCTLGKLREVYLQEVAIYEVGGVGLTKDDGVLEKARDVAFDNVARKLHRHLHWYQKVC